MQYGLKYARTDPVCSRESRGTIRDDLRNEMSDLQERFTATIQHSGASSLLPSSDPSLKPQTEK